MDLKVHKRIHKLKIECTFGRALNKKKESFSIKCSCFLSINNLKLFNK